GYYLHSNVKYKELGWVWRLDLPWGLHELKLAEDFGFAWIGLVKSGIQIPTNSMPVVCC
ncbi:16152_t:CDS:1, partial [Funneliformis caledonium]